VVGEVGFRVCFSSILVVPRMGVFRGLRDVGFGYLGRKKSLSCPWVQGVRVSRGFSFLGSSGRVY